MVYRIPRELTIRRKKRISKKRNKSFKNNKKNVTNNNRRIKKSMDKYNHILKTCEKKYDSIPLHKYSSTEYI